MLQQVILPLISKRYLNGLLNGKCLLIHILPNKLKKLFFLEKWWSLLTLELHSIACLSKMFPHKKKKKLGRILDENLWVSSERKMFPSWHSELWQRCHNVIVDVVTTLWHDQKWVAPTSVSKVMTTSLSDIVKSCHNVATMLPQD